MLDLSGAQFEKGATFKQATFHHRAFIRAQNPSGAGLDFSEAEFLDDVEIDGRKSPSQKLIFRHAKFKKGLAIVGGAESGSFDFSGAEFHGDVIVKNEHGELIFARARFGIEKPVKVTFRGSTLHQSADFSNACFLGPADFENVEFGASSSFLECSFHAAPNFHNASLHQGTLFSPHNQFPRLFRDVKSRGASNAYRTLKLAMHSQHALSEELGFFLLEMRAAASQQKPWVQPLYWLYDAVSLYGLSVKRPLMLFFAVTIGAGLLYSWLADRGWGWWVWDSELLALTLYGAIPFAPALRLEQISGTSAGPLFPPSIQPIIPVIVAAQGIVSAALLFLVILGLRNMFKIK